MKDTNNYVCGFQFDDDLETVLLIEKNRPSWQAGHCNGIGGSIEPFSKLGNRFVLDSPETPHRAMVREFEEETGVRTEEEDWTEFIEWQGDNYTVHFFCSIGDLFEAKQTTDEPLVLCTVPNLLALPDYAKTIWNVRFLVQMALCNIRGESGCKKLLVKEVNE